MIVANQCQSEACFCTTQSGRGANYFQENLTSTQKVNFYKYNYLVKHVQDYQKVWSSITAVLLIHAGEWIRFLKVSMLPKKLVTMILINPKI